MPLVFGAAFGVRAVFDLAVPLSSGPLSAVPGSSTKLVWSKASPGYTLDSESSVQASFVVSKQHPIDWLFG